MLIDRGYTSHEYLAGVELIHMNGRLYDPLLRRFLNADENIQDPYNTQNYNKYGYVMNNPLMYNDPSGEVLFMMFGIIMNATVHSIVLGAIYGMLISAGTYIVKSVVTGNWSWGGFAKSLLIGAVTGGATGGLLGMYSATSFNGAVVLGSMNGGISGGIQALFNGENFFTGLYRGAVMGGALAGIGYGINWSINKLSNSYEYQINEMLVDDSNTLNSSTKADFSIDTVQKVEEVRYKNQFIRGSWHIVDETSDLSEGLISKGYTYDSSSNLLDGPRGKAWGVTEIVTHKGKLVYQRIFLPKGTFISLEQLDLTMGHEIFHSILNNARLFDEFAIDGGYNTKHYVHEHFTAKWEDAYVKYRGWSKLNLNVMNLDDFVLTDKWLKPLIDKITPIFNNYLKSTLK